MNEKIDQLISKYREFLTSLLNQYLDSLYEDKTISTSEQTDRFEILRRKIIEGKRLNDLEFSLILLLVTHALEKIKNYKERYSKAFEETTILKENLISLFNEYKN